MSRPRALVTGASRGIGKAIAIALAKSGHDVAISARTVKAGESRENTLTIHKSDTRPLPGSLEETAAAIEAAGGRALMVAADLTDRPSVVACAKTVLDQWGGVDVLIHNGRYLGPGLMDVFMDIPHDAFGKFVEAHATGPLVLTQALLPGMLERGGGKIIMISSGAAYESPPAPAGQGGWGLGYSVGKAAGHMLVPTLNVEFKDKGILAFNVNPGFVGTERNEISVRDYGRELVGAAPPAAIGAVIAWLATSPEATALAGSSIDGQELCLERGLHPSWK